MTSGTPRELFEKGLLSEDQFRRIDAITSKRILSVFYELRSLLYLGVLLFTTGTGLLIYENINEMGHLVIIFLLSVLMVACFWSAFKKAPPFSKEAVKSPTPYFDYIVLLGSLLYISVQGYIQFEFRIFDENLGLLSLITAVLFFFVAYRFDHAGVLSLAITAMASFWGLSISPQKWYSDNFFSTANLHVTAVMFGTALAAAALVLDNKSIKRHFTFTYINFSTLIFFTGAIAGLFINDGYFIYLLLIFAGCAFTWYMARQRKSFLFLSYAFIAAYIGTTYLLATIIDDFIEFWFYYSLASCGAFIFFIIRYKNYFNRSE